MKKKMYSWGMLFLSLMLLVVLPACSDDDDDEQQQTQLVGKWKLAEFTTDNQNLNATIPLLLAQQGIELSQATFTFGTDEVLQIDIPRSEGEAIQVHAAYAYKNNQLALRFDDLPIPFNAFNVNNLTDSQMTLQNKFSALILKAAIKLLETTNPEVVSIVEALLGDSLTNGLDVTIRLTK